jgi:predicted acylesterase/phospholipase RssA
MRVLTIDGGGIRGIIPARVLCELESRSGRGIQELFDLIVGTSAGGLIALAIATPHKRNTAADLYELFRSKGGAIFPPKKLKAGDRLLRKLGLPDSYTAVAAGGGRYAGVHPIAERMWKQLGVYEHDPGNAIRRGASSSSSPIKLVVRCLARRTQLSSSRVMTW